MLEQAEQDCLQQRQIRDHSLKLQTMARLQNQMIDIMARNKLTAEERINLISKLQIRFDQLRKETDVLCGALPAQTALEASPSPPPAEVPKPLAEKGIRQDAVLEVEENEQVEESEENDKSSETRALSPMMAQIIRWKIPGLYHQKAR